MSAPSRIVVVGASWGGLEAVGDLLGDLDAAVVPPVAIAQHRGADAPEGVLARTLQTHTELRVVEVDDKMAIEPGCAYIGPPDYHLLVDDGVFSLSLEPPVRFSRPSVDALFESAADVYGPGVVAVVLTGANDDGARGVRAVKDAGGVTIAQDPSTAARPEMPEAAIASGCVDRVLSVSEIASTLNQLTRTLR